MNRSGVPLLIVLACALSWGFSPLPLASQQLSGIVLEEGSGEQPVMGAIVQLYSSETREGAAPRRSLAAQGLTDERGRFSLRAEQPGDYLIVVSRFGYQTNASTRIVLEEGRAAWRTIRVIADPIPIAGIDVEVEGRRGLERGRYQFARRSELGQGYFFDRSAIASMEASMPSDVFYYVPSLQIAYIDHLGIPSRPRIYSHEGWGCMLVTYNHSLNVLSYSQARPGRLPRSGTFNPHESNSSLPDQNQEDRYWNIDTFTLDEVEGIEVYRSYREVPDELKRSIVGPMLWPRENLGGCGLAIIWTDSSW